MLAVFFYALKASSIVSTSSLLKMNLNIFHIRHQAKPRKMGNI